MAKRKSKLVWWKWRQLMSSHDGPWHYEQYWNFEVANISELEEYLVLHTDIHALSNWGEHYRGIEGSRVSKLPEKILNEKIDSAHKSLADAEANLTRLQAMWRKWYGPKT